MKNYFSRILIFIVAILLFVQFLSIYKSTHNVSTQPKSINYRFHLPTFKLMWYINVSNSSLAPLFKDFVSTFDLTDIDNDGQYELVIWSESGFCFIDPITGNIKKYKKILMPYMNTNPSSIQTCMNSSWNYKFWYEYLSRELFARNILNKSTCFSPKAFIGFYYFYDVDCDCKKELVLPLASKYFDFDDAKLRPILPKVFTMDIYNIDPDPYPEILWFNAKNGTIKIFEKKPNKIRVEYEIQLPPELRRNELARELVCDVDDDKYKELFFISHDFKDWYCINSVLFEVDLNPRPHIAWSIPLGNFSFWANVTDLYPFEFDYDLNLELFMIVNKTILVIDPIAGSIVKKIPLLDLLPEDLKDVGFCIIPRCFVFDFDHDGLSEVLLRYVLPISRSNESKLSEYDIYYALLIDVNDHSSKLLSYPGEAIFFGNCGGTFVVDIDNDSYYEIMIYKPDTVPIGQWVFSLFNIIDINNNTVYKIIDENQTLLFINKSKICGYGYSSLSTTRLVDIDNDGNLELPIIWNLITMEHGDFKDNYFICMLKITGTCTLYDYARDSDSSAVSFFHYAVYDLDKDFDGLARGIEEVLGTSDYKRDSDDDGLLDSFEFYHGLDPTSADPDGDFVTDSAELLHGTNPFNCDSDGDLVIDCFDLNPNNPSDGFLWHCLMCITEASLVILALMKRK